MQSDFENKTKTPDDDSSSGSTKPVTPPHFHNPSGEAGPGKQSKLGKDLSQRGSNFSNVNTPEIVRVLKVFEPYGQIPGEQNNGETQNPKLIPLIERYLRDPTNYDTSIDDRLPETVKLLTTPEGVKVYLIGTAHFSEESHNDVKMIMEAVNPQAVLVELCKLRAGVLNFNDKSILPDQNLTMTDILDAIKEKGVYSGLFHLLLVKVTVKLSDQLNMLPGGEFRTASEEAQKIAGCPVYLADRPLDITVQRTVRMMSLYEMLRLCWMLMTMNTEISKEEMEMQKKQSEVEEFEMKMKQDFPVLKETFVTERNMYLTYMFQACIQHRKNMYGELPQRVVGVVGMGHSAGIVQHWGKITSEDVQSLLRGAAVKENLAVHLPGNAGRRVSLHGIQIHPAPISIRDQIHKILGRRIEILWLIGLREIVITMEADACNDQYEHTLPGVMYVIHNIPGPGLDVKEFESEYIVGCKCISDCWNCPCTRASPNYVDGRIVESKLAGPIVECNSSCSCGEDCGNRVVQKGPLDSLVVVEAGKKGLALATEKLIEKGQFICEYAGEVIGIVEARRRIEDNKRENGMNYVLVVSEHIADRVIVTCIDPKYFGNIGRYCNHSCEPSAAMVPVRVENAVPRICLFAARDIRPGEEITFNYAAGIDNDSVRNYSDTVCLCGSTNCAGYLPHDPI